MAGSVTCVLNDARIRVHKGPVGPLRHRCSQCSASGPQLLRCSGCRAVRYCSREHQIANRPRHKSDCNKVKKERNKVAKEEHLVRNAEEDFMTPANAFETHVGSFWGIFNTREYMRARFALAEHLRLMGTLDSVREALDHLQDMLRLSRSDNMGVRCIVPAVMLRLDLDQECYDFVKWWSTCDPDGQYDWGDMTLPYLDLHGADVLETPDFFQKYSALNHTVAILLLKLKFLVDIRNLTITRKIPIIRQLPAELRAMIELAVIRSPLSAKLFQKQSSQSLLLMEAELLGHIHQLGQILLDANGTFTFYLFNPDEPLSAHIDAYSIGSWEEMAQTMQYSYAAWWETEGVLALLNDARTCAVRELKDEIVDMGKGQLRLHNQIYEGTVEELSSDLGKLQVWTYLIYAMQNATYLGPWSKRPSEQIMTDDRYKGQRIGDIF